MALRAIAGDRVDLMLVAPEDAFVYRPLTVEKPYTVERLRRVPLRDAAAGAGAGYAAATIQEVDLGRGFVTTSDGDELEYEALVVAVGARAIPAVERALTWDDRLDAELIGGLLQDFEGGYTRRLAVIQPPGPSWPLRAYELAFIITRDARAMGFEIESTLVMPERSALDVLDRQTREHAWKELEAVGATVVRADEATVEPGDPMSVVLRPSETRIAVDRVMALPVLRGRAIAGIPADPDGFVAVDDHCRVPGLDRVWAIGDATASPVKAGAFAAEQADVAAEDIAAAAGAGIHPRPFDPAKRQELLGLPAGEHLRRWLSTRYGEDLTTHLPSTGVPTLTYLERDLGAGWRG